MQGVSTTQHDQYTEVRNIQYEVCGKDVYYLDLFYPKQLTNARDEVDSILRETTGSKKQLSNIHTRGGAHGVQVQRSLLEFTSAPPVVVFVHGGGWQRGDRRAWTYYIRTFNLLAAAVTWFMGLYHSVGSNLAVRGVACAVITYPLAHLSFPWTMLDFILSYAGSIILSFICQCFVTIILRISSLIWGFSIGEHYNLEFPGTFDIENLLMLMTFTNILMLSVFVCLLLVPNTLHVPSLLILAFFTILIPAAYSSSRYVVHDNNILFCGANTAMLVSSVLFRIYTYTKCRNILYLSQVSAIGSAVKWVREFGKTSKYYDSGSLFLMGHSAGGHLVSTIALGDQQEIAQRVQDIKGVISISGVYDLQRLSTSIFRYLYLHPAFGDSSSEWRRASPMTLLREGRRYPPFLLVTAQYDGRLNEDARQFSGKLKQHGVDVERVIVPRTSHLTIIANFKSLVCDITVDFIQRTASIKTEDMH